mgnify:CR=1 FL=1
MLFISVLGFLSCSDSDEGTKYAPATETVTLTQSFFSVDTAAQTVQVGIKADHEFAAYSNDSWLSVSPSNSISRDTSLTIQVSANKTSLKRNGTVVIWCGGTRDSIKITQDAGTSEIQPPLPGYSLVWNDEFDGSQLGSDWTYEVQSAGWVNNELQNYVQEDQVAQVSDGTLKINLLNDNGTVKSARIYARKSTGWKYGYIEALGDYVKIHLGDSAKPVVIQHSLKILEELLPFGLSPGQNILKKWDLNHLNLTCSYQMNQ